MLGNRKGTPSGDSAKLNLAEDQSIKKQETTFQENAIIRSLIGVKNELEAQM
jgi:hypothetical protein